LDLTRDGLRSLDDCEKVEVLGARASYELPLPAVGNHGGCGWRARGREGAIELFDLSARAPAGVRRAGALHAGVRNGGYAARSVEARGDLPGDGLGVHEALLARCPDGLVVTALRVPIAPLDAGDLGRDQCL